MEKLQAKDNYWLTQAKDTPLMERVFAKEVALGVNDSKSNWKQITHKEYLDFKEQIDAIHEQEMDGFAPFETPRNIQGTIVAFILGLLLGGLGTITMVARELMQAYKYDFDVECDDIIRYSITASVGSVIQLLILTLWIL